MAVTINASTSAGAVTTADTSGVLQLQTGGTAALTVNASQNVGIGTSSPAFKLDTISSGSAQVARFRLGGDATSDVVSFERNDSAVKAVINYNGTDGCMSYGTTTNHPIAFLTNNTERARFNSTGALVFAGGTTTANGIGITFPATQSASTDANTLDDYEEGTWSATITTSGGSVTIGSQTCTYTKVGRLVVLNGAIALSAISSPTGQFTITNLPFIPSVTNSGGATCFLQNIASTTATALYVELATTPRIYIAKSTTLNSLLDSADLLAATTLIKFGASYST
jgi:hypothetical protein